MQRELQIYKITWKDQYRMVAIKIFAKNEKEQEILLQTIEYSTRI